jgi:hypothetical protein
MQPLPTGIQSADHTGRSCQRCPWPGKIVKRLFQEYNALVIEFSCTFCRDILLPQKITIFFLAGEFGPEYVCMYVYYVCAPGRQNN